MRARHPDYFPDSWESPPRLNRDRLRTQLETLGNRQQEQEFDQFARWLTQLEICPDLIPITAPAEEGPAIRAYWCAASAPKTESRAFAFSTTKDWRHQAHRDCAAIASIDEKYDNILLVTSRDAPAKERKRLEHELTAEHGSRVEIHDRTWLVERVFTVGRQRSAAEILGIEDALETRDRSDAADRGRAGELEALTMALSRPDEVYGGNRYALALDCLRAARIARTLGRPREDVEELLSRARDLADRSYDPSLQLRARYDRALTLLFWYEDLAGVLALYLEMEQLLPDTAQPYDMELLHRLLLTLFSAVSQGGLFEDEVDLDKRVRLLRASLEAIAVDDSRPDSAAYANLILATGFSPTWIGDEKETDRRLRLVTRLLDSARELPDVPVLSSVDLMQEIEFALVRQPAYPELRRAMQDVVRETAGATAEGELLLKSGSSLVMAGEGLAALDALHSATALFAKAGILDLALRASIATADAYRSLGMLWAARMEALSVAALATRAMDETHELSLEATFALRRVSDCELKLGRIHQFLGWHLAFRLVADKFTAEYYDTDLLRQWGTLQDGVFSVFLMNLLERPLEALAPLEGALGEAGLPWSRWVLLYRTGHADTVLDEVPAEIAGDITALDEWMVRLGDQPVRGQMTPLLQHVPREPYSLETELLGVRFTVVCPDTWPLQSLAEDLMGVLEIGFSSAGWKRLAIVADEVTIELAMDGRGHNPPRLKLNEPTRGSRYVLTFGEDVAEWVASESAHAAMGEFFHLLFLKLLFDLAIDPREELEAEVERWYENEVLSHAIAASPTASQVTGILGADPYALT
jgi:hypothetical protein